MFRSLLRGLIGAAAGLPALPVRAQEPPPPRDTLPRVIAPVVVRERVAARTSAGAALVAVSVDSLRTPPGVNLDLALRTMPFVNVRTNSRGEAELSVRGSDSRQPAVFLEGAQLSLGWDSRADASIVPLTGASGIRVSRTLSSLMLGPNVVGGAIEVGLTTGLDRRRGLVATGADHTSAYSATASFGGPMSLGPGSLAVIGGIGRRDRREVAAPAGVDAIRGRRVNSDFEQTDLFGAARFTAPGGAFAGLTFSASDGSRGVPPELHITQPRLWRIPDVRRQVGILSLGSGRFGTPWGLGGADLRISHSEGHIRIEDYGTDRTYSTIAGTEEGDERTTTARLVLEHSLGPRGDLGVSATHSSIGYDETLNASAPASYEQRLRSVAVETDWKLASFTELSLSAASDHADNPATGGRPPLGARSEWAARIGVTRTFIGAAMRLHASASSRARFPALRELYSGALNRFEPNPSLRPERLLASEVGVSTTRGRLDLQSVLFFNRLEDAVVRVTLPSGKFQRVNRNRVVTTGLELLGTVHAGEGSVIADLTLQDPQLISQATDDRTRPEYQPHVRSSLTAIAPLLSAVRVTTAVQFTGAQYCENPDLRSQQRLGESTRLDTSLDRAFSLGGGTLSSLRVTLALDNVLDRRVFEQCGLPQPGRTLRLGLEVR